MAEIHGNAGSVTFAGIAANVMSWSLSWDGEVHDITSFDDAALRIFMAGLSSWTATIEANHDATNTAKPGDTGACVFNWGGGTVAYTGTIFVTNVSVSTPVDGIVTVTYAVQGSGLLSDVYA
jgi:hypothetical protein